MSSISNPVRGWLRLEALTVFVGALVVWAALDGGWGRFALYFLVPDIAIAGYLLGPRAGAATYNVAHSVTIPLALGILGGLLDHRLLLLTSTLWLAHIGFDRTLGLGLKYPTGFRDTHLGRVGVPSAAGVAPAADLSTLGAK